MVAEDLWDRAAAVLKAEVSEGVFQSTFSDVRAINLTDNSLELGAPNVFVKDKLENRFRPMVEEVVAAEAGKQLDIQITLAALQLFDFDDDGAPTASKPAVPAQAPTTEDSALPSGRAMSRYTFETFVIGSNNRFAHATAMAVTERPGEVYNPLFIYGGAGLGKTHLLRAIENGFQEMWPGKRVLYVSTETFLNELVDSIRTNNNSDFKGRYRTIDLLLLDDIQFIAGKEQLQEELFHTFNQLYGNGSQVVISSDRTPDEIPTLEDRLRSRFMSGLLVDVQPPELETRMAILQKKAERDGYYIPSEVSGFIAENITSNVRELEGALTRVIAYANIHTQPLTEHLAKTALRDLIADRQPRAVTVEDILESTGTHFTLTRTDLLSGSRRRPLVTARQIAMYLARQLTDLSYPMIAHAFDRDHSTVHYSCEKITKQMQDKAQIFHDVTAVERLVRDRVAGQAS